MRGTIRGSGPAATRVICVRWKAIKSPSTEPVSSTGSAGRNSPTASITSSSFDGQRR